MGKRQIRIRQQALSAAALTPYIGSMVDVLLADGSTHHGRLAAATDAALALADANPQWYNRKAHQHSWPYSEVREVVALAAVPY